MDFSDLLQGCPPGSPERAYFNSLNDLFESSSPRISISEVTGFAFIRFIESATITLLDGRIIGDDFGPMGSIEDISNYVACRFQKISGHPIFWKAGYPSRCGDDDVVIAALELAEVFRRSPLVKSIR